jgi:hypothetical protein
MEMIEDPYGITALQHRLEALHRVVEHQLLHGSGGRTAEAGNSVSDELIEGGASLVATSRSGKGKISRQSRARGTKGCQPTIPAAKGADQERSLQPHLNERRNRMTNELEQRLTEKSKQWRTRTVDEASVGTDLFEGKEGKAFLAMNPLTKHWPKNPLKNDMHPELLLQLAVHLMQNIGGVRDRLTKICLSEQSVQLFVCSYWFVHCRIFQPNSELQQQQLLELMEVIYPDVASLTGDLKTSSQKDAVFIRYPFACAKAIDIAFPYLYPGSQHLFTASFRRDACLTIVPIFAGPAMSTDSILSTADKFFPDDYLRTEYVGRNCLTNEGRPNIVLVSSEDEVVQENKMLSKHSEHRKLCQKQRAATFDANQGTTLMQSFAKGENVPYRPRHPLRRTGPAEDEQERRCVRLPRNVNSDLETSNQILSSHKLLKAVCRDKMDKELLDSKSNLQDIEDKRRAVLKGGSDAIAEKANNILSTSILKKSSKQF